MAFEVTSHLAKRCANVVQMLIILIKIGFYTLASSLAALGLAALAATTELPRASGNLTWDKSLTQFSGVMAFELAAGLSEQSVDFSLYPNRYLQAKAWSNRENLEANTRAEGSEDSTFLRQRASLVIRESHVESFDSNCKDVLGNLGSHTPIERLRVPVTFNRFETIAKVELPVFSGQSGCRLLVFNFLFNPPYSVGNFGVVNTGEMHFSGPVFPFPRNAVFDTEVVFKNLTALCAQCVAFNAGTVQKFSNFPAPVHFFSTPPNNIKTRLWNREVVVLQLSNQDTTEKIVETLQEIERIYPFRKLVGETQANPIFVMEGLLTDKLVLRHPYEIQIGTGFHKINALFKNYHDAALARGVLTEILIQSVNHSVPAVTPELHRRNTAIGRWLADVFMRKHHKGLDTIRNLSNRLMFIPLFNDIFRGKALVNNDVFLGSEETETALDSKPVDILSPTFNGKETQDRVEWCFDEPTVLKLAKDIDEVFAERKTLKTWIDELNLLKSDKCNRSLSDVLTNRSTKESIEINVSERNPFSSSLEFTRRRSNPMPYSLFQADDDVVVQDKIYLRYGLLSDVNHAHFKIYESNHSNDSKLFRTNIPEGNFQAFVEGPTTDTSDDLHKYPRQREFLISGLKMRYNSVERNIDGQTGLMWRYRGDKYSRVFTLNLIRDKGVLYLEPTMSGELFLSENPYLEDNNERFIRSIPFGLGLPVTLGAAKEIWVSASTGFAEASRSILAPEGYSVSLKLSHSVYRKDVPQPAFKIESNYTFYAPVAKLLTLVPSLSVGRSTEPLDAGNTYTPGIAGDTLWASNYIASRLELRGVVAHNMRINIGNTVGLEHLVFFGAHNFTAEVSELDDSPPQMPSLQSVQFGFRLFGTFFGAKDQMVAFAMSRGLTQKPNNVFSFAIGGW